jgi:predicted dehydrogenase
MKGGEMMGKETLLGRRGFLMGSAGGAAASARLARGGVAPRPAASDKVTLGFIGVGVRGRQHHLKKLLDNPRVEIAAICDVDENHAARAGQDALDKRGKQVELFDDFRRVLERKDIDAVVLSPPDHWHSLIAIAAMEAGKDVYCEKPLTLTIAEGRQMVETAKREQTVFQNGSQQRSDLRFRLAVDLVRKGRIGKLQKVSTHLGFPGHFGNLGGLSWPGKWEPYQTPPEELNWNMWLGPAPYRDYTPGGCHFKFRYHLDHSGGRMTDWGAHHNDIAQWANACDRTGPVEVDGGEATKPETGPDNTHGIFDVRFKYANGVELVCSSGGGNGVRLTGSDGWLWVTRLKMEASSPDILRGGLDDAERERYDEFNKQEEIPGTDRHHENWLDCIASREQPRADIETGHRTATVCHLGNISMRLGRPLRWNPEKEEFVDDQTANIMAKKPMRAPWCV